MKTDKLMSPGEVDADVAIRGDVLIQGFDHVAVQCLNVPVQLVRHDTDLRSDFIHEVRLAHRIHPPSTPPDRSEEHTSELQSRENLVCRLLLEKKKKKYISYM